jgi:hypothetical protein
LFQRIGLIYSSRNFANSGSPLRASKSTEKDPDRRR